MITTKPEMQEQLLRISKIAAALEEELAISKVTQVTAALAEDHAVSLVTISTEFLVAMEAVCPIGQEISKIPPGERAAIVIKLLKGWKTLGPELLRHLGGDPEEDKSGLAEPEPNDYLTY